MNASFAAAGCIVPNEPFDDRPPANQAPRIDLAQVRPRAAVSAFDVSKCVKAPPEGTNGAIQFTAVVTDPDDASMLVRWVVRDEDDTRHVSDAVSSDDPGEPRNLVKTMNLVTEFRDQRDQVRVDPAGGNRAAMVLLYVTDAPGWAIENPDEEGQGQKVDGNPSRDYPADFNLGAIPPAEELGGQSFSVTTFSWAVEFNERGLPCP